MIVKLINCTPDFLKTIWFAARTCYSSLSPIELQQQKPSQEEMLRIADHIISSRHLSVLEHCHMTFAVEGVSRALLAQYSRHRIGISLSVQSQRHVSPASNEATQLGALQAIEICRTKEKTREASKKNRGIFNFVVPPTIAGNKNAADILETSIESALSSYSKLIDLGIKKEDARFILPGGACTNFVTSLNLRSLFDVYEKRVLLMGAQWEIKNMIITFAKLIMEQEPWLEKYFQIKEKVNLQC